MGQTSFCFRLARLATHFLLLCNTSLTILLGPLLVFLPCYIDNKSWWRKGTFDAIICWCVPTCLFICLFIRLIPHLLPEIVHPSQETSALHPSIFLSSILRLLQSLLGELPTHIPTGYALSEHCISDGAIWFHSFTFLNVDRLLLYSSFDIFVTTFIPSL